MARRTKGHVRLRAGRYQASIQVRGQRYTESFDLEEDALAWIDTIKGDAVRGVLKKEKKRDEMRFDDLCRHYQVHKQSRWRPGMLRFFLCHVRGSLVPHFGGRQISTITTLVIQGFLDHRLTEVSAMTVSKAQQILTQVFRYAVRMGFLEKSPMAGVERSKLEDKPPRVFRLHELQAILKSCPGEHSAFFTVLALTGLRRSEMFRLSWDWCDFESEKLLIREAKRGSNEMPMAKSVRDALLALGPRQDGRVFPGRVRGARGPDPSDTKRMLTSKRTAIRTTLKAAGVDPRGVGLHTFRHTFIDLLEKTPGVTYSVVKALARHSMGGKSRDITARYLHPTDEQLRAALAKLEEGIFGVQNKKAAVHDQEDDQEDSREAVLRQTCVTPDSEVAVEDEATRRKRLRELN